MATCVCVCGFQSAHERTWDWYRFGVEQERLLLESWHREQAFLRLRTLRLLEDARVIYDEEQSLQSDRLHQQHICVQLRQKVTHTLTHSTQYTDLLLHGAQPEVLNTSNKVLWFYRSLMYV